jgi:hypothetical protein
MRLFLLKSGYMPKSTGYLIQAGGRKIVAGQLPVMTKRQMRKFALQNPAAFKKFISGSRERELTARHLLLTPSAIPKASEADLQALAGYLRVRGWSSLYGHDRRMWRLLRDGAERFLQADIPGIRRNQLMRIVRTMGFRLSLPPDKSGKCG